MQNLYLIALFVLGTIVGSFLNVVILRFHTGRKVTGRSSCATCGTVLTWYELVPVLSFLALRGKCKTCGAKISWQYASVEALTGVLFALVGLTVVPLFSSAIFVWELLYYLVVMSLLVVLGVYDIKHKILPDPFVFTLIFLSALSLFVFLPGGGVLMSSWWHVLAAPILWAPFAALWYFSKGKWMGLGDAKLVWGFGWLLGLTQGIGAVMLGFWIGAVVGIAIMLYEKLCLSESASGLTMKREIPFGPALILGLLISLFFNFDLIQYLTL